MALSIKTREIQYTAPDGTHLIGYFAAPESETPVAGVIVAPEWWGRNEYTEQRVPVNLLNTAMERLLLICMVIKKSLQQCLKPVNG